MSGRVLIFVFLVAVTLAASTNRRGWELLASNEPDEAAFVFRRNVTSVNRDEAAEALRGLSVCAAYTGRIVDASKFFFNAYQTDGNIFFFSAGLLRIVPFSRTVMGALLDEEGYRAVGSAARRGGLLSLLFQDELVTRYLNDGKTHAAKMLLKRLNIPSRWMYIGPFENLSNSGYAAEFPPEYEIDFSKSYPAKDGNWAAWHEVRRNPFSAWMFAEEHCKAENAVNYFYCSVESDLSCDVLLGFGASGFFKVFLNGTIVLADSLFRNTGMDIFMQRVHLLKGKNALLVKLGHEWQSGRGILSNFSLHFLDEKYQPLTDLRFGTEAIKPAERHPPVVNLAPSPFCDTVGANLKARLATRDSCMDAAILLMDFYNANEMTDSGQALARAYLRRYPQSALWRHLLSETLRRAKKHTEAEAEERQAYALSPVLAAAWESELQRLVMSQDPQRIIQFIEKSSETLRMAPVALLAKVAAYAKLGKRNEAIACLRQLKDYVMWDTDVVLTLASFYVEQGTSEKAIGLVRDALRRQRSSTELYGKYAELALQKEGARKCLTVLKECVKYNPTDASAFQTIAYLYYLQGNYAKAEDHVRRSLAIRPADETALNLLGNILVARGNRAGARKAYEDAILFTDDDFNAWDNLRLLDGKAGLDTMASIPNVDSLISAAAQWKPSFTENGVVISSIHDVFVYPSRCWRERDFIIVYLPTQHSIDVWKEYNISYHSRYQIPSLSYAYTRKADGTRVEADAQEGHIVFKSLEPGDHIVMEWSVKNYYYGEMARHVWGSRRFQNSFPTFDNRLRLITPLTDSLPYQVFGDSIARYLDTIGDYRIVVFERLCASAEPKEKYLPSDWPEFRKVNYSTFSGWGEIARWYTALSQRKQDMSLELAAVANSLFGDNPPLHERVRRVHRYITQNIRYSYVPFRQSGWIPQRAHDVVVTRIGDCKDMSLLGVTLLRRAGVPAYLVLVNTSEYGYIDHAVVGPTFDHCITMCEVDDKRMYIDFTDADGAENCLPIASQNALALIVSPSEKNAFRLPLDSSSQRLRRRLVKATIDSAGNLSETVRTIRRGVYASLFRMHFRNLSERQRRIEMQKMIAADYPSASLTSLTITDIDSLRDSIEYEYSYLVKGAASIGGNTAVIGYHVADRLKPEWYPSEEERNYPIDFSRTDFGIATYEMEMSLSFPQHWKLVHLPSSVELSSPYGKYQLTFTQQSGNTIHCRRKAVFSFTSAIEAASFPAVKEFLDKIARSDAVQFVFILKGER